MSTYEDKIKENDRQLNILTDLLEKYRDKKQLRKVWALIDDKLDQRNQIKKTYGN